MKKFTLVLLIGALGCTSTTYNVTNSVTPRASSTPPVESATPAADPAPVASSSVPVPTAAPSASIETPKAVTPPVTTPPAAAAVPATSPEGFRAKSRPSALQSTRRASCATRHASPCKWVPYAPPASWPAAKTPKGFARKTPITAPPRCRRWSTKACPSATPSPKKRRSSHFTNQRGTTKVDRMLMHGLPFPQTNIWSRNLLKPVNYDRIKRYI